jgi:hypothetical protein
MIHLLNLRLAITSNYAAGTRPASIRIEPSMCNGVSIGSPPTQRVRPSNVIAGTSDVRAAPEIAEIGAIRDPVDEGNIIDIEPRERPRLGPHHGFIARCPV